MNKMKVELVKVKINKLKEVKKQLQKRKSSTKKNLKTLLLENEERDCEDNILYQSINALFEEEKYDNEPIHSSTYYDSHTSDYRIDIEELLESLGDGQNDHSLENPSESLSINEPGIYTEDRTDENITVENSSTNSLGYLLNMDNNNSRIQEDEINLCDDIETFLQFNSNCESALNLFDTPIEPEMLELGNYYIPDTVFETTNDTTEMDEFCNQIGILITEDPNKGNTENQIQYSEEDNPAVPDLIDGETNNHTENEVISNQAKRVAMMVNPLLVSIPEDDLQTAELYQLEQKNDSKDLKDLEEIELLKNYGWEIKANIIASAKMAYTKRTRTLLHWLDPKLPLTRIRTTLELSWQNLPLWQKEVYISQVLGPLSETQNTPMLNPQLKSRSFKLSRPTFLEKPQYERKKFSDFINQ